MGDGLKRARKAARATRVASEIGRNLPDFNVECPHCGKAMKRSAWSIGHFNILQTATCTSCWKQFVAPVITESE